MDKQNKIECINRVSCKRINERYYAMFTLGGSVTDTWRGNKLHDSC